MGSSEDSIKKSDDKIEEEPEKENKETHKPARKKSKKRKKKALQDDEPMQDEDVEEIQGLVELELLSHYVELQKWEPLLPKIHDFVMHLMLVFSSAVHSSLVRL